VIGDYTSANEQDAIVYYDHVDYPTVTNFSASQVSRFIQSGVAKNTSNRGLVREGYFANLYCEFCGTPGSPIIEINSVNGTGDSSNLLSWYNINLWSVRGVGVAIKNANAVIGERRFKFYGLRIERDDTGYSNDLLQIGDPSLPGKVYDVAIYGFVGNTVGLGSSAIGLYASSSSLAPTGVVVDGSINAGGAAGNGINIQAGNTNSFRLSALSTSQFGVVVGASPLVGANNHFDELGLEQSSVPFSIDSSCLSCISLPQYSSGGPSPLTLVTDFGYQALSSLTSGTNNSAFGYKVLSSNTTGAGNTAMGHIALSSNATGNNNVAVGNTALQITTAGGNTAVGAFAGEFISSGLFNTCIGDGACAASSGNPITGNSNTTLGHAAGTVLRAAAATNTLVGDSAASTITTGSRNLVLGANVGKTTLATGSNNILLGNSSSVDTPASSSSNEINIGNLLFWNSASTAAPAVSSCGTSPAIDAHANNRSGTVTAGSGTVASCTITLAGSGYSTWNHCRVTSQSPVASFTYSYTTTAITLTGTSLASDKFDYDCDGY